MLANDFGKSVKIQLIEMGKTQNWLIEEVKKKTGLYFDDSYLWRILNGKSNNAKIITAINETLISEKNHSKRGKR